MSEIRFLSDEVSKNNLVKECYAGVGVLGVSATQALGLGGEYQKQPCERVLRRLRVEYLKQPCERVLRGLGVSIENNLVKECYAGFGLPV